MFIGLKHWKTRFSLAFRILSLSEKAKEIEQEWQRIQQSEHDFFYEFKSVSNEETQARYLYKKGIADGIKWCLKRSF